MQKKILAIALALAMLVGTFPLAAFAQEDATWTPDANKADPKEAKEILVVLKEADTATVVDLNQAEDTLTQTEQEKLEKLDADTAAAYDRQTSSAAESAETAALQADAGDPASSADAPEAADEQESGEEGGAESSEESGAEAAAAAEKTDAPDYKEAVAEFLESLDITTNFVVYADTYSTYTHIDGNIAVDTLASSIDCIQVNSTWTDLGNDVYSYIGSTANGQSQTIYTNQNGVIIADGSFYLQDKSTIISTTTETLEDGTEVEVRTESQAQWSNEAQAMVDSNGDAVNATINLPNGNHNNATVTHLVGNDNLIPLGSLVTEEDGKNVVTDVGREALLAAQIDPDRFEQEMQIDENLAAIAAAAQVLNEASAQAAQDGTTVSNWDAVKAAYTYLDSQEQGADLSGTVISITLNAENLSSANVSNETGYLVQGGNNGANLQDLYYKNVEFGAKGATIILNVDTTGLDSSLITISQPLNSTAYGAETQCLVWNFGSYSGEIVLQDGNFTGILVAPLATVIGNCTVNGRVIASSVTQSMEFHPAAAQAVKLTDAEENETPAPTATPTAAPDPSESPDPEATATPTATPTPDPSESPDPEATATPTATPTPEPSESPDPEATATPAATPNPMPMPMPQPVPEDPDNTNGDGSNPPDEVEIEEEAVPMAGAQEGEGTDPESLEDPEALVELADEETPLSAAPHTGDALLFWCAAAGLALAALAERKRRKINATCKH
jgi:hypothetical protein